MITTCTRQLTFDAGHRLLNHGGKCAMFHGHTYRVLLTARRKEDGLDAIGRVVDFSVLKEKFGSWIERYWDHGFLLNSDDTVGLAALRSMPGQKLYSMPSNPTAENIARYLLENVAATELYGTDVELVEVTVWETPNCYATVKL